MPFNLVENVAHATSIHAPSLRSILRLIWVAFAMMFSRWHRWEPLRLREAGSQLNRSSRIDLIRVSDILSRRARLDDEGR